MPLPSGAHYEDRSRRTVQLSDGSVVKRQTAMNLGAQEIGFSNDRHYRHARNAINGAKRSARYQQDVRDIKRNNPGITQREIDRVLLRLYQEKEAGISKNQRDRSPGSAVQQWNALTGRAVGKDWSAY